MSSALEAPNTTDRVTPPSAALEKVTSLQELLYRTPFPKSGLPQLFPSQTNLAKTVYKLKEVEVEPAYFTGKSLNSLKGLLSQYLPKRGTPDRASLTAPLARSVLAASEQLLRSDLDKAAFTEAFTRLSAQDPERRKYERRAKVAVPNWRELLEERMDIRSISFLSPSPNALDTSGVIDELAKDFLSGGSFFGSVPVRMIFAVTNGAEHFWPLLSMKIDASSRELVRPGLRIEGTEAQLTEWRGRGLLNADCKPLPKDLKEPCVLIEYADQACNVGAVVKGQVLPYSARELKIVLDLEAL